MGILIHLTSSLHKSSIRTNRVVLDIFVSRDCDLIFSKGSESNNGLDIKVQISKISDLDHLNFPTVHIFNNSFRYVGIP